MKIKLRILATEGARLAAASDPKLVEACNLDAVVFELDATDDLLDRFLERTHGTAGSWFNPVMSFTKRELDAARCFQLECRGKLIRETDDDFSRNRSRLEALDFVREQADTRIKLIDQLSFSKIKLAPNAVGCASDWMPEIVAAGSVVQAFESAGLTGLSPRTVLNPKSGKHHPDLVQLYSESIMPSADRDATTPMASGQDGDGPRELGCLTYSSQALETTLDFNRTAENWSSNDLPLWVVSAKVRDVFVRNKFRGLAFRPVLEQGSKLHQTYLEIWETLIERVSVNPRNHF